MSGTVMDKQLGHTHLRSFPPSSTRKGRGRHLREHRVLVLSLRLAGTTTVPFCPELPLAEASDEQGQISASTGGETVSAGLPDGLTLHSPMEPVAALPTSWCQHIKPNKGSHKHEVGMRTGMHTGEEISFCPLSSQEFPSREKSHVTFLL